ncbi:MAG: ATP/GTP-binding protein [Candidatus Methanosuratincola petrocarbonis]
MLDLINIYIVGPAGSGKSALVQSLGGWMESKGYSVSRVNLDPGAELICYPVDFDIREFVTVTELMRREQLGPNGALIRAAEIVEARMEEISKRIGSSGADFRILDTPGQMEIFLFRSFGPSLVSKISGRSVCIFTIDPCLASTWLDVPVIKLLALVIELRLGIPALEVMTKSDMHRSAPSWLGFEGLPAAQVEGLSGELASSLASVVGELEKKRRLIPVSSKTREGMEDLYKAIGELFCSCGDLT